VFASWDVWDWGTTGGGVDTASAKLDEARIARKKVEDQVRSEAREAFVNAETAREALGVARTAVEQAEENYRIVSKKFEANAATSFDVVDAESLLTQARGQVETGLYDYLIARAALERATGTPLPGEQ
jgi:outer membrane protein TolC